jgi:hypothetical protein
MAGNEHDERQDQRQLLGQAHRQHRHQRRAHHHADGEDRDQRSGLGHADIQVTGHQRKDARHHKLAGEHEERAQRQDVDGQRKPGPPPDLTRLGVAGSEAVIDQCLPAHANSLGVQGKMSCIHWSCFPAAEEGCVYRGIARAPFAPTGLDGISVSLAEAPATE